MINENIRVEIFNNYPSPEGYFYELNRVKARDYLILIGAGPNQLDKYLRDSFSIIYNEENCYLLSK